MRISDWSSDVCSSDLAVRLIGMDRLASATRRQRPRGVALPVLMLPANLADLGRAMPLGKRAKRRAGLDRLQLLGIADKNHLRPRPLGRRQHALHLARADHAGLVDHQRSEEPTSELQSLMRISYAVF